MPILYPLRPAYPQCTRNLIPHLPIMKRPPLPTALLPAKPPHYLLPARMTAQVLRDVQDRIVDHDPEAGAVFAGPFRHFRGFDEGEVGCFCGWRLEGVDFVLLDFGRGGFVEVVRCVGDVVDFHACGDAVELFCWALWEAEADPAHCRDNRVQY